jgi:trk system potassium uptake protein TrkH
MIIYILGHLLRFEAIFLFLPMITGVIYDEIDASIYMLLAFVAFVIGTVLTLKPP